MWPTMMLLLFYLFFSFFFSSAKALRNSYFPFYLFCVFFSPFSRIFRWCFQVEYKQKCYIQRILPYIPPTFSHSFQPCHIMTWPRSTFTRTFSARCTPSSLSFCRLKYRQTSWNMPEYKELLSYPLLCVICIYYACDEFHICFNV